MKIPVVLQNVSDKEILVPSDLGRFGLAELVEHMTQNSNVDFVVSGILLRTTLQEHLDAHQLSPETTLVVTVINGCTEPRLERSVETSDWLSCCAHQQSQEYSLVVGSLNGSISLYSKSGLFKETAPADDSVKAIAIVQQGLVAARGQQIVGFSHQLQVMFECTGHMENVECVASNGDMIVSGGWDNTVRLWDTAPSTDSTFSTTTVKKAGTKRQKTAAPLVCQIAQVGQLDGHSGMVSGVIIDQDIYSCSFDHSVRIWDTETRVQKLVMTGAHAMTSMARDQLLAIGASDGAIRLYDTRTEKSVGMLRGHDNWVSGLDFNDAKLASCGYDGKTKMWDLRCDQPLFSFEAQERKFDVSWQDSLVNVGADGLSEYLS